MIAIASPLFKVSVTYHRKKVDYSNKIYSDNIFFLTLSVLCSKKAV